LRALNPKKLLKLTLLLSIIVLSVFTASFLFMPVSFAQPKITYFSPDTHVGKVGETIKIKGLILTENGEYKVFFDEELVYSGIADGNNVEASFEVPNRVANNYTVKLQDVTRNENVSTWFSVETAYSITPELPPDPQRLQQGASVTLHVNVTGGEPNMVYHANITVKFPYPLNTTHSKMVTLSNTTNTGFGYANVTYPDDFPPGAHTNFTGLYLVYFNKTQNLAEHGFFIGLLNASQFHRGEVADICAVGYKPNTTATITITFKDTNETVYENAVNASQQGKIRDSWLVPMDARVGGYNITITGETTTPKEIKDSQLFTIPGYQIDFHVKNLAGKPVKNIFVEALDKATDIKFNRTSGSGGLARFFLEKGEHVIEAFWKDVKVGEIKNLTITGKAEYNLVCELTDLTITVKDEAENVIPFVRLEISYQFTTTKDNRLKNETLTGETNFNGVFQINSTLPRIQYIVNASRYGKIFNPNNNTVASLPAKEHVNVTILCPAKTLTLNITDHNRNPFANAQVEVTEQMGGISYTGTTDSSGILTLQCTFGKYNVKVYAENILLNKTSVELFEDQNVSLYCKLYNLTVSVKAIDYFGQPIPNVNVTITREKTYSRSALTKLDGTAQFPNFIGGKCQIDAYLNGQEPLTSTVAYIDENKTIELKIEKYVFFAGTMLETSQLAAIITIIAIILSVLIIEVYLKRKREKLSRE